MKYLVIDFDRYDTERTQHQYVEASSAWEALEARTRKMINDEGVLKRELEYLKECFQEVTDDFACWQGDESDILIYRLPFSIQQV